MGFVNDDGSLILARWAERFEAELPGPTMAMYGTPARALPLVSNGDLGLDLIQLPANSGFEPHTHYGDHLLIVVAGRGTITYGGTIYETAPGQVYLVEGATPHAVGAITDHAILAVGAPHRQADDADRMTLTAYTAVAADMGQLICLPCGGRQTYVGDSSCPHAPKPRERVKPLLVTTSFDRGQRETLAEAMRVERTALEGFVTVVEIATAPRPTATMSGLFDHLDYQHPVAVVYGATELINGLGYAEAFGPVWATAEADPSRLLVYVDERSMRVEFLASIVGLACTMAAAGPLANNWSVEDAERFLGAVARMPVLWADQREVKRFA